MIEIKRLALTFASTASLLMLSGCPLNLESNKSSSPSYTPEYSENACPMEPPQDLDVVCGTLTVPENRSKADNGREVKLAVATLRSSSESPEVDPLIYLHGGPGSQAVEFADSLRFIFRRHLNRVT